MPGGVAGGDDRIQDPAGALGQGPDPDWKEDPATCHAQRCAAAHQDRSLVSPDRESQLSADDCAFSADLTGHDHPLLSGMVSDALHRLAIVHGIDVFDFELLPGFTARAFSQELAARTALSAVPYGSWHRIDHHEHESRDRSIDRD